MLYPLTFEPIFKERIWGGRNLERLFSKPLPLDKIIGESWEITDRPEAVSVVSNGNLRGKDLRWLLENLASEMLGASHAASGRFPLLVKILDASQTLSVQVHPPLRIASGRGGEPKTELWRVVDAAPNAKLFAGLKRGVTRERFESGIKRGTVADALHSVRVAPGDSMFLPSGRVHAIGAGLVIFEIQQNSDTTYRVFDWNRRDAAGRSRDLHIAESLESIDFDDFEPELIASGFAGNSVQKRKLADCPYFSVDEYRISPSGRFQIDVERASVVGVISGVLSVIHARSEVRLTAGQFSLLPGSLGRLDFGSNGSSGFLLASAS